MRYYVIAWIVNYTVVTMNSFTNFEYLDIVKFYVLADFNTAEARRLYSDPDHLNSLKRKGINNPRIPTGKTFNHVWGRLMDYGQFRTPKYVGYGSEKSSNFKDKLGDRILDYLKTNPKTSVRKAAQTFNVNRFYISKLLKNQSDDEGAPDADKEKDAIIASVYHYLKKERDERGDKTVSTRELRQRAALACGVGEGTVRRVLKNERDKEHPDSKPRIGRPRKRSKHSEQRSDSDDDKDGEESELTLAQLQQRKLSQNGAEPAKTREPHRKRGRKRKASAPPPEQEESDSDEPEVILKSNTNSDEDCIEMDPLTSADKEPNPEVTDTTVDNGLQQEETEEVADTLFVKIEPREFEECTNHQNGSLDVKLEVTEDTQEGLS